MSISSLIHPEPTAPGQTWMRVTPRGIERPQPSWAEMRAGLRANAMRVARITRGELKATYFGRSLGWLWLLLEPLLMSLVYWFLTAVVFDIGGEAGTLRFLTILVEIVFWVWFYRAVGNACVLITGYASLLRDTDLSVNLLLAVTLCKDFVVMLMNLVVTMVFLVIFRHIWFGAAIFAFPLVLLAQVLVMVPFIMVLAVLGTFVKDLNAILGQVLPLLWYLSPALFPTAVAQQRMGAYAWVLKLNPLYWILPPYQQIFIEYRCPALTPLLVVIGVALVLNLIGLALFRRARYYYYAFL